MDFPKVSVIVPVYNTEKYLQRCIDSLLRRSYKNVEFIFVDDGSTDNCLDILEMSKKKDNRIKIIKQVNEGPSAARNTGVKNSRGKYIMFCDSDDTVTENWCEVLVNAIEEYPDAWIISGVNIVNENGETIQVQKCDEGGILGKDEYYKILCKGLTGYPVNKIYSAQIIKEKEILFDKNICHGEDVIFNLDYMKQSKKIYVINQNCYNYYRYTSRITITGGYHKDDFYIHLLLHNYRLHFVLEKDIQDFKKYYWNLFVQE